METMKETRTVITKEIRCSSPEDMDFIWDVVADIADRAADRLMEMTEGVEPDEIQLLVGKLEEMDGEELVRKGEGDTGWELAG